MSETRVHEDEPIVLEGDGVTVTLRKAYTPNGQLLEISSLEATDSTRLDAIELESVTWQDRDTLYAVMGENGDGRGDALDGAAGFADARTQVAETVENPDLTITNEYAEARIGTFSADGVACCVLVSPKLGYYRRLTPGELDGLAALPHTAFSTFLEKPYGPE